MVKEGAVVIDVGINQVEDSSRERGWRLVGDVDYQQVRPKVRAITPVPQRGRADDNRAVAPQHRVGSQARG